MSLPLISVNIQHEHDTVAARQRARQIARLLGFDAQDQTRISTAVSEIARNAFNYAKGGKVEYLVEGRSAPQLFIVRISDRGPGILNLDEILEGRYQSTTGMGLGIVGARRLMDQFQIDSVPGSTVIQLKKLLPKRAPLVGESDIRRIADELALERPQDAFQELQLQNRELLQALEDLRARQADLKRVNKELEDTNRGVVALYAELDEKADHLRRADELKSKFLSNMSHEFRSPLNSILALSGLLINRSDGDLTREQDQQIGYIRRAANDLLELVNDLLDLAKVEAGKLEARPIEFEVSNLFAALRGMLRPLLLNQSVDLIFEHTAEIPTVYSDEGKISQILRNFISNALKFTERGEVRVGARTTGNDEIVFFVSDTGIGIATEDLDLIFQDFVQLDHPLQRHIKGTGLGLPLSRKLATFLGGNVSVESEPGAGSTFTLRVPRQFRESREEEPPAAPEWTFDPGEVPVLFIEDSPEMVLVYNKYLKDSGFRAISAGTTREAEDLMERLRPRAIVLDIVLRSENTWALLAKLKQDTRTTKIPVLVASTIEDQAKGFHLGADAYLVKPFDRGALLAELRNLTGDIAAPRALIVDDSELDRYILRQHLRSLTLNIAEAAGGAEGIRKACDWRPDVIFLDLAMPEMTGFEVIERLKNIPASKNIPVIIITSQALTEREQRRLMENAFTVLSKENLTEAGVSEVLRTILT